MKNFFFALQTYLVYSRIKPLGYFQNLQRIYLCIFYVWVVNLGETSAWKHFLHHHKNNLKLAYILQLI